jgi:SnoaL-like domain
MKLKNLYCIVLLIVFFSSCSSTKLAQQQLLARITTAEDKLEILTLLSGSAFSSDVASEYYWAKMFTQDAVFDRGQERQDKGLEEILKIVNAPDQHEAIKYGMTHLAMLPHITLKGDSAVATGYLLIVMPDTAASHVNLPGKGVSPGFSIYQLTVNRWLLLRTTEGWKVTQRTIRPITSNDSRNILKQAIEVDK